MFQSAMSLVELCRPRSVVSRSLLGAMVSIKKIGKIGPGKCQVDTCDKSNWWFWVRLGCWPREIARRLPVVRLLPADPLTGSLSPTDQWMATSLSDCQLAFDASGQLPEYFDPSDG